MAKEFRKDIAGLRAIAVLAVTFFHIAHVFKPEGFSITGGFLGVDIFFVISGYLMTMIIMGGVNNENFSLWTFYKRRAQRICPALFTVVIATLAASLFLFRNDYIHESIKEALPALGFISNFRFARDLDYFDGGDFSHLFLHTWSLSVEWQFYIVYPALILLINKLIGARLIPLTLAVLTVASFATAIFWTDINARQSYFLLPSRACELLVGSLAYFYPLSYFANKTLSNNSGCGSKFSSFSEGTGLLIIFVSIFIIDDKMGWPTAWLALPMFGTWLCIAANNQKSLLSNVVFQKIGLWSYAIYLVHWPFLVYAHALGLAEYSFYWLIPIFVSGYLLHVLVERRRNYTVKFTAVYFASALLIYIVDANRLYENINSDAKNIYQDYGSFSKTSNQTVLIGTSPELIVHGDSHSTDFSKALVEKGVSVVFNNKDGCYSLGDHYKNTLMGKRFDEHNKGCSLLYLKTKGLAEKYKSVPIVVSHNWRIYGDSEDKSSSAANQSFYLMSDRSSTVPGFKYDQIISNDILTLAKDFPDRKIFIIGNKQVNTYFDTGRSVNHALINSSVVELFGLHSKGRKTVPHARLHINEVIKNAINDVAEKRATGEALAEIVYIEPDVHCSNGLCELYVDSVIPVFYDGDHYSWAGSVKLATKLLEHLGISAGPARADFDLVPDIDFDSLSTVLEYYEDTGFKFPDEN